MAPLLGRVIPFVCAVILVGWRWPAASFAQVSATDDSARLEFFEKQVRPLLADRCYNCHSADTNSQSGLRVDDRQGLVVGGNRGAAVIPGEPDKSLLIRAVRYQDDLKMPPKAQLTAEEIAILERWVAEGAVWPKAELPATVGERAEEYDRLRREHWAWQPLRETPPPAVQDTTWPRDDVDRYVLSRLEQAGLHPAGDARRQALLRRVTFDLTGLPPTPEEIDAFVEDESPGAFERVVDRLLASPAHAERWARHWLDLARYGESTGSARNLPFPHAWRYRDYVIQAIQTDKPYPQFLQEQIAGDLLPARSVREKAEQLVATGFLALGVKDVNQRFKVRYLMDNVDEQIDTVTRSILGLTVSCARCHDHKFDPVPTSEYYALAGIFRSTDLCAGLRNKMGGGGLDYYDTDLLISLAADLQPTPEPTQIAEARRTFTQAQAEFRRLQRNPEGDEKLPDGRPKRAAARQKMNQAQQALLQLTDPAVNGPIALGVRDSQTVADTEIRVRGEAEKLGPVVPRGFLSLISLPNPPAINPRQSGRLELAQWLSSPDNPLTQRVLVNRVWQHLFGTGLVASVDNFGVTGEAPSHPELLDHLAIRFVRGGSSLRRLIRTLVLSRTYQLAADSIPANLAADPANRLLWRHTPRRLDAEEIRDAMLASAGTLDSSRPQGSPAAALRVIELRNNGPEARRLLDSAQASRHRSLFLPLLRGLTPESLEVFDFAEQGLVTGQRETTTVAPQALYLLNDVFIWNRARELADRLLVRADLDDARRVHWAYRLTFGRSPSGEELNRSLEFLDPSREEHQQLVATNADAAPAPASPATPAPATSAPAPPAAGNAPPAAAASVPAASVPAGNAGAQAAAVVNPDDPVPPPETPEPVRELPRDPRQAAWTLFVQALLAAAEFRYLP
jgi:cytochrome c553